MVRSAQVWGFVAGAWFLGAQTPWCAAEEVILVGKTQLPATATDLSGQTEAQENGTPQNRLGGLGSGIAWTGHGNRYVMLPDRGPDDGAVSYRCRFQVVEIRVNPQASHDPVTVRLLETHLLKSASGENFVGRATFFDREHPEKGLRLDPEGIRVSSRGTILIADEYGPSVREFDNQGRWKRDLHTPERYRVKTLGATPAEELPPHNTSGRQNNRGWEGLALNADGTKVYTIAQSPLIQDGGLNEENLRVGTNIRLLELDMNTGKSREFLYPLEDKSLGCSEVEVIDANRLLVIERDSRIGEAAQVKSLFEIDLSQATDISGIDQLPTTGIPDGVRPVAKKLFLNLLAPELQLAGATFPEKIEGVAFGPRLPDGSRILVVASDNDFKAEQPTDIYAFIVK